MSVDSVNKGDPEEWTRNALVAFSAVVLHQTLRISKGTYTPLAFCGLLIAGLALMFGVFGPRIQRIEDLREKAVFAVLGSGVALQFVECLSSALRYFRGTSVLHVFYITGIAACAVLTLSAATRRVLPGNSWFVAVLLLHFLVGIAYLNIADVPAIDVILLQRDASTALLSGHNPYVLTYPNIYGNHWPTFYGPGIVANGRVLVGFPYPPLSLFLCLPSYLLTGDVRYSHLAATTLSGMLIGFTGRGLLSKLAAVLFLFSPAIFYVIQSAWTEPFVVLLFSLVLFQCRLGGFSVLSLGLLVATKQYAFLVVPVAAWFLIRKASIRVYSGRMLRVAAVTLAVTLPLVLWNVQAFIRSAVMFHLIQPFRPDELSIPAWLVSLGLPKPPTWPAFVVLGVAAFFLIRKLRSSPTGFAVSLSVLFMVFFSLNKQAALNYYFLIGACLCGAVAAADRKAMLVSDNLLRVEPASEEGRERP